MTPLVFLGVCAAGGLGAALRLFVDGVIGARRAAGRGAGADPVPRPGLGTSVINISGSLLLGLLTGLTVSAVVPADLETILGVGLLGGYTTFSTAAVETVRFARQGRQLVAVLHGIGMLVGGVTAALVGYLVGTGL